MSCWCEEPPTFISVQTIVSGFFVRKAEEEPEAGVDDETLAPAGIQRRASSSVVPQIKADELWGTTEFSDLPVTFDTAELEERARMIRVRQARRQHGLAEETMA